MAKVVCTGIGFSRIQIILVIWISCIFSQMEELKMVQKLISSFLAGPEGASSMDSNLTHTVMGQKSSGPIRALE